MKIQSIKTKTGQEIELGKISVLVGPNNVGKSQTLKDIKNYMSGTKNPSSLIVLDEIRFFKPERFEELLEGLTVTESEKSAGQYEVSGMNLSMTSLRSTEINIEHHKSQFNSVHSENIMDFYAQFSILFLDADNRLQLVKQSPAFNQYETKPENLIQSLFSDQENLRELREIFLSTFNMDIELDISGMVQLCLRVAKEFPDIPEDPRDAYPIMKDFGQLDVQGDGFKSFVGIILSILFSSNRVILLDEPEAFLHPAQARMLGKWISDNESALGGQLIISTHNANFLNGILSGSTEVDIYRLNREEDVTSFNKIPAEATKNLSHSPMLSSQRVLESIFYRGVVVCEADADRTVYQTVSTKEFKNQETLFIHSHNKQTLKDVAALMMAAKIPVKVVADIDLLNTERDLKLLLEVQTENTYHPSLLVQRQEISDEVDDTSEEEVLSTLKTNLEELLGQLAKKEYSYDGAKGAVSRIKKEISKWDSPKKSGIEGFPEGIRTNVLSLIGNLKNHNIYIVPVGQLEGWMDVGVKKKNKWIIKALEEIHKGNSSTELKGFVQELISE